MSQNDAGWSIDEHRRFARRLLAAFVLVFIALGWSPSYRADWLLENALVLLLVPLLVIAHRRLPLSKLSYTSIFVFLCLHEVGAHYTYAEVPYDAWFRDLFGQELGALLASVVIATVHASLDRDFTREWIESLRVKQSEPMGEVAARRLLEEGRSGKP